MSRISKVRFEAVVRSLDSQAKITPFGKSAVRVELKKDGKKFRIEGHGVANGFYSRYSDAQEVISLQVIGLGSDYTLYMSVKSLLGME